MSAINKAHRAAAGAVAAMPLAFVLAACGSAAEHDSAASTAAPTASNIPNTSAPSITASQAPSPTATPTPLSTLEIRRDIKVGRLVLFKNDNPDALPSMPVTVTNHTRTATAYDVKVDLMDRDGKTVLGPVMSRSSMWRQGQQPPKTPDSRRLWTSQFRYWTTRTVW